MHKDDTGMAVSLPTGAAWYVIQCRANQNFRAQENLENQGFTCFQPQLWVEKLRAGRRRRCHEPLFPGYLFIQLHEEGQSWHSIRSTRGVQKLVTFGDRPVAVPDSVVDNLKLNTEIAANDGAPAICPGDRLRIESGPFANLEAIFQRFAGEERVVVLMSMLHKQHALTLALKDVQKI